MTLPPAAVERLRVDLAAALGRPVSSTDVIAVAVSGGPDSMALLALAAVAWPGRVIAATVDHGLRAAGADEAAMVAGYCRTLNPTRHPGPVPGSTVPQTNRSEEARDSGPRNKSGVTAGEGVPHATLCPAQPLAKANIQANARAARYALLTDWAITAGATILTTAHHADDQAETFLMRAARGSGLAGLSAVRARRVLSGRQESTPVDPHVPVRPEPVEGRVLGTGFDMLNLNGGGAGIDAVHDMPIPLVRPLLGWRRTELRDLVVSNDIPFVDDPSNADDHYDRTRFRRLLAENDWLDPVRLAQSARYAREGHEALDAMIEWLWHERMVGRADVEDGDEQTWLDLARLPREIIRRLAREAIEGVRSVNGISRPAFTPASNIEPLLDAVTMGTSATQAGILVSRRGDIWHFRQAPARRDTAKPHS